MEEVKLQAKTVIQNAAPRCCRRTAAKLPKYLIALVILAGCRRIWGRRRRGPNPQIHTEVPRPASPPSANTSEVPRSDGDLDWRTTPTIYPAVPVLEQSPPFCPTPSRAVEWYNMREFCTKVKDTPDLAESRILRVYRHAMRKGVSHEYIIVETAEHSIRLERRGDFAYSWTSSTSSYPPVDEVRLTSSMHHRGGLVLRL